MLGIVCVMAATHIIVFIKELCRIRQVFKSIIKVVSKLFHQTENKSEFAQKFYNMTCLFQREYAKN